METKIITIKIRDFKVRLLREIYEEAVNCGETCGYKDWVEMEAGSDPGFFRWLTDIEELEDFQCPSGLDFDGFLESLKEDQ
ncbi:MAG: hypothetical protein LBS05_00205 [Tannerellaceae bacterium]|jgi:hypothetical protein|nr:hypothetical protein [Tannerellaceae bacterium]